MIASETLKALRTHLGITMREVEDHSRRIAEKEDSQEYYVSNAWLSQLENKTATPSIYKLYSLSVIYRTKYTDLLLLFGVDLEKISGRQMTTPLPNTHLTELEVYDEDRPVSFPVRFDPGFRANETALLSRMVEVWGEIPLALLRHLQIRKSCYGFIGLKDYTLHPMIRPGSFVQIDDSDKQYQQYPWRSEYDRPIYFIELRKGYACSWCDLQGKTLTLIPHPLSPCKLRHFEYPHEAEIIGRVTSVAMRLVDHQKEGPKNAAKLPKHT